MNYEGLFYPLCCCLRAILSGNVLIKLSCIASPARLIQANYFLRDSFSYLEEQLK